MTATPGTTRPAERIARLGTETAFAVGAEAAAFAAQGNTVYPFHLGDMNLPTPDNIAEASFKALREGKNGYCPNNAPLARAGPSPDSANPVVEHLVDREGTMRGVAPL